LCSGNGAGKFATVSRSWRRELITTERLTYHRADRGAKSAILDRICSRTGYHRKYAIQLLNRFDTLSAPRRRGRPRRTEPLTDKVLGAMWYAMGRPGALQLAARMAEGVTWARQQLHLADGIEQELLSLSVRTIDRRLEAFRKQLEAQRTRPQPRPAARRTGRRGNGTIGAAWPHGGVPLRTPRWEVEGRPSPPADPNIEVGLPKAEGDGRMSAEFTTRKMKDVMVISAQGKMVAGDHAFRLMKLAIRTMNETDIRKFVVDLGRVTLIDSAGVGELVAVNSAVKEKGGQLRLSNLEDSVGKVLQMALIHKIIPCFDTQKEAIASLGSKKKKK
jgi:anti-sigma B factor antagonist